MWNFQQLSKRFFFAVETPHLNGFCPAGTTPLNRSASLMVKQYVNRIIHHGLRANGRCRAQLNNDVCTIPFYIFKPFEGMHKNRQVGGFVRAQLCRTQKGRCTPRRATAAISSSSVETITRVTSSDFFAAAMLQAISGITRKRADILTRNAFRAATSRDESEDVCHKFSIFSYSIFDIRQPNIEFSIIVFSPSRPTTIDDDVIAGHVRRGFGSKEQ